MRKYPLIGGSIVAVVVLVLSSLTNVIGYQTVQSSNLKMISNEIDQKELLFQTIVDMVNNKEIQKVILGSEITGKRFSDPDMRFSVFNHPVLTEKRLKRMYTMGVILFKTLSKSKMQSMIKQYQVGNQETQKEINAVIEKNAKLKNEITQLSNSKCDCENENTTRLWNFPVICAIVLILGTFFAILLYFVPFIGPILNIIVCIITGCIGELLNCWWFTGWPPYFP